MAASATTFFFAFLLCSLQSCSTMAAAWVKSAYWYSGSEVPVSDINSALFTHLICSFAYINSSTFELSINSSDVQNFASFTDTVKRKNPRITTLLSIWGGRQDSATFTSMVGQSSSRKSFIKSSIESARAYGFHGLDLSGVLPSESTNVTNFVTLLKELRDGVESESKVSGKTGLVLTMAVYYMPVVGWKNYPIESMKTNLDWAHIVAYDYHLPTTERFVYPHAALFDPSSENNTDFCVVVYISRGFPASKLVLGLPFHGYAWKLENVKEDSVGSPANGPAFTLDGSMGYKTIKSYIQDNGYGEKPAYNSTYVVNFFVKGSTWINYDGPEVIKRKVLYAKEKGLLGYNVFQVSNDADDWALAKAAHEASEVREHKRWFLHIALISAASVILLLCAIIYYLKRSFSLKGILGAVKRSTWGSLPFVNWDSERIDSGTPTLQAFSFAKLKAATSNFSSENKLGEGGFGPVYGGKLSTGQLIAVKRLSRSSNQGLEEFKNEVMLTARLQHVNLVRLLGFCTDREEKMLIYEYMARKSLDFYLFDPIRRCELDWEKRIRIIEGITQGLLYLQQYSNFTVIHRDLKASNVLLDSDLNPKISDFGMARIFGRNELEANTGRIVGTYGYVPPEYVRKGIYSMKYDVFSFGVLLLQIISGKRTTCYYGPNENLNLLEYAYEMWRDGYGMEFIDPSLDDSSSSYKLMRCMQVALLCVQEKPADRPSIVEISSMLRNETVDIISPKEPAFSIRKGNQKHPENEAIYSMNDVTISDVFPR